MSHPPIKHQVDGAQPLGAAKGFTLRTDFPRALTHRGRLVLVGEATGLVNPFTGEGVDYALKSAELATTSLAVGLDGNGTLQFNLKAYDRTRSRKPLF